MLTIRSLTLSHVAGVRYAHLTVPDTGVTVVHGPNEAGKSTLLRAVRLLLDDTPTSSKKREVKALKDVSADEPTTISADLVVGPYELSLTKAYNKGGGRCELRVTAPRAESLTGREATDRFAEIMRAEVDTDMLDALTVEQGESLNQLEAAGLGPLERALGGGEGGGGEEGDGDVGTASSAVGDPAGAAELIARIEGERARYFTPGGRPTKELRDVRTRLESAQEEKDAAAAAYNQAQSLIADLERLRAEKDDVTRREPEAKRAAAEAAEALRAGQERQRRIDEHSGLVTRCSQALELARHHLQSRDERVSALTDGTAARDTAAESVTAATEAAESERKQETEIRDRWASARRRARTATAHLRYLTARRQLDEATQRAEKLSRQKADAADLRTKIASVEGEIDGNPVTAELMAEIRQAVAEGDTASRLRDAAAARVKVDGPVGASYSRDGEEQTVPDEPGSHDPSAFLVTRPRTLGIGEFTVTVSPARDLSNADEEVARAEEALRRTLDRAGVDRLDEAETLAATRQELQESLAVLCVEFSTATGGVSAEELDRLSEDADRAVSAASDAVDTARHRREAEDPDGDVELPDNEDEVSDMADAAEHEAETLRDELDTLARAGAGVLLETRKADHDRAVARVESLSAALETARTEASDEELQSAATTAREDLDAAEAAHAALIEELGGAPDAAGASGASALPDLETLQGLADGAEAGVTRLRERSDRISLDISAANGALGEHSGVAERLESATTQLQRAERDCDRVTRQAEAADALYRAVTDARDDARRRYEAPYRASVEKLSRTLYGRAVDIEFDENLGISRRVLDATALDASQLSGGAREQLAVISRLAVADIVGGGEGVPVVIDDALGFSDTARISRMNLVLSTLGKSHQIIVLTCDPARFDSVPGATVTSMAELQGEQP